MSGAGLSGAGRFTIGNLAPAVRYEVQVWARNGAGDGVAVAGRAVPFDRTDLLGLRLVAGDGSAIPLEPVFDPATFGYTATLPAGATGVRVTAVPADAGATLTVNGVETAAGSPSALLAVRVNGPSLVTVIVRPRGGWAPGLVVRAGRGRSGVVLSVVGRQGGQVKVKSGSGSRRQGGQGLGPGLGGEGVA